VTVRSEDAPVNTGAIGWPTVSEAHAVVRRIQNKLHCWASADRARRFDDLYNLVCDARVLTVAWERVAGNQGARTAGIDRATVAWIETGTESTSSCTRSAASSGHGPSPRRRCGG
jgi:RNA-directed DNA polymerase